MGFFTLPFTPYGYKFESNGYDNWNKDYFLEKYKITGVEWATRKPWTFGLDGFINLSLDTQTNFAQTSYLWNSTVMLESAANSYDFWIRDGEVYVSSNDLQWFGFSVHKTFIYSLFTPYGYKFESIGTNSWDEGAIYESYGTGVKWAQEAAWHIVVGGIISLDSASIATLGGEGRYWSVTSHIEPYFASRVGVSIWGNYTANFNSRRFGNSVRKLQRNKYLSFFLRPMGISLKGKQSGQIMKMWKLIGVLE